MFLTNEKRRNTVWLGSFFTRKWNNVSDIVYFEKEYGGKPLLKKAKSLAKENNLIFNSSMVNENSKHLWASSGWLEKEKLNVLSLNLKNLNKKDLREVSPEFLTNSHFEELLHLDKNIFDEYWQNSLASFQETLDSCNKNYLFKQTNGEEIVGYAILGVTNGFSYLQRFGINKNCHSLGYGQNMLEDVISFAKRKNFINMKLNTQEKNFVAQNLYLKNGFEFTKTNFIIFESNHI